MILARWTYSREEWKSFLFRHKKRRNLLNTILFRARPFPKSPEVVFTAEKISIGERDLYMNDPQRIREISLYQEGSVNVMRFVMDDKEVRIPIPKGRIREALELRTLLSHTGGN